MQGRNDLSTGLLDRLLLLMTQGSGLQTVPANPGGILGGAPGAAPGDEGDEEQAELVLPHCSQPLKV